MSNAPGSPAVLECRGLSKSFGATRAVQDVSLTVAAGRALALVGENGAGKSTLMNIIAGAVTPDEGQVLVEGRELPHNPAASQDAGVAMVHQELSLFANLTVAENIVLGQEPAAWFGIKEADAVGRAASVLDDLGIQLSPDANVGDLSPGLRQLVELAKAVASRPNLLILDEPTSSLEGSQVDLLYEATRRLLDSHVAIIFVSHRLEELYRFCDDVLVLRGGEAVASGLLDEFTHDQLITAMVGRDVEQLFPPRATAEGGEVVLALRDASTDRIHGVDFEARAGSITGVAGLEGHGQADVAELLAGVQRPAAGHVELHGERVDFREPRDAIRRGVGYVPPDRRTDGLMLVQSVAQNLTVAALPQIQGGWTYRPRRERSAVHDMGDQLRLQYRSPWQTVAELSGGNQQKVLFGRWLMYEGLHALVLNDPTRGVDIGARTEIYEVLHGLAEDGVAVVLVSTDMLELLGLANDIYVMYTGRVTGVVPAEDADEKTIMRLAVGAVG